MIGTLDSFEVTFGSFGQQYTTIDGARYITWFDLADPTLKRLGAGALVEFEARPGPTVLCHSPHVTSPVPCATLVRVVTKAVEAR